MKKATKFIALLLCLQMILPSMSPLCASVVDMVQQFSQPSSNNLNEGEESFSTQTSSIFPESELKWMSFRDYLLDQARKAWNTPSVFVGYEATFLPSWQSFICTSGFDNNQEQIYVSLSETRSNSDLVINPNEIKLVIEDFYYVENSSNDEVWYKVKAAEGYALPPILESNPYVMYVDYNTMSDGGIDYTPPTFLIGSQKAIFISSNNSVSFLKQAVAATASESVPLENLPALIEVQPVFTLDTYGKISWDFYDVSAVSAEYTENGYPYVALESVVLIPAEASIAYDTLMSATDTYEYYAILSEIPQAVLAQLSDAHKAKLDICIEELDALEHVQYESTVQIGTINLPVHVEGKLPDNVELTIGVVDNSTLLEEGFQIEDISTLITALDIKLINTENGTEWQPEEGRRIAVSIGVGELGCADNTVVQLQHKHGQSIETFEILVVQNGAVTVYTAGFSIFVVTSTNTQTGTQVTGNTITLKVGDDKLYYCNTQTGRNGTWTFMDQNGNVTDKSGAVYYTVYSESSIGNGGMRVPYIRVVALKEASNIKMTYNYYNGNNTTRETYTLNIITPTADPGKTKLYLKDEVNTSGKIIATLVDETGKELSLDGAAFTWTRSDDYFITPKAYGDNYRSVNIAVDHGGLVEARKNAAGTAFEPTEYRVDAILANGTKLKAEYTVYYQSEIINANFEFPPAPNSTYSFFPNGWPELHWKTTAPGKTNNITKDIEYGDVTGGSSSAGYGVTHAPSGVQFAELNAEEFGALYQDIITAPGEDIEWQFTHAPRQDQSWSENTSNAMFIIIGATETSQELSHSDMEQLGAAAKQQAGNNADFLNGRTSIAVTYKDAVYYVWYHDAGTIRQNANYPAYNNQAQNYGWTFLEGSYTVPAGQYRTRLFFVSEKKANSEAKNAGNLIDSAKAGQYKSYLIEYYIGVVDKQNQLIVEHLQDENEFGDALIYSTVYLENIDTLISEKKQYLHKILINGENYPYNLRYAGDGKASLYIEKYIPSTDFDKEKYKDYDIVMQVFLRDVVISVQKEISFPTKMTNEQKLTLIQSLESSGGYRADFLTTSVNSGDFSYSDEGFVTISQRDPSGNYTGYYGVEKYPSIGYTYRLEETATTDLVGLRLVSTQYTTYIYDRGLRGEADVSNKYSEFVLIRDADHDYNFAEIFVKNTYEEKMTTIHYKAVGNGKVAFIGEGGGTWEDTPTEQLAFYSGEAKGAEIHAGIGASFAGWYLDPECKTEVTAKDGVWDKNTGNFYPNANIINADEITFYAKFETGSIEIERTNALPGQTFVYRIQAPANNIDIYVTLQCDNSGNGMVQVLEVPLGYTYTVTELEDWSWRHTGSSASQSNSATTKKIEFKFTNSPDTPWLNGCSPIKDNVYK